MLHFIFWNVFKYYFKIGQNMTENVPSSLTINREILSAVTEDASLEMSGFVATLSLRRNF